MLLYGLFAFGIPWLILRKSISSGRIKVAWIMGVAVTMGIAFFIFSEYRYENEPQKAQMSLSFAMFWALVLPPLAIYIMKKKHLKKQKTDKTLLP